MAQLAVKLQNGQKIISLIHDQYIIGRGDDVDIRVRCEFISRSHAVLNRLDGKSKI